MSVFYSYSNHRETTVNTFNFIADKLDFIIDVDRTDQQNSHQLLDKINNHIESSIIFVCDITPDIKQENKEYASPNVMLELGYALNVFGKSNIIILLNEHVSKYIPSMLNGFNITKYDSSEENYQEAIINVITEMKNNIKEYDDWQTFEYKLSNQLVEQIKELSKIQISNYLIRINSTLKKAVILFYYMDNKFVKLNIINKTLSNNKVEINLEKYNNIYLELKHLELIINVQCFLNKY